MSILNNKSINAALSAGGSPLSGARRYVYVGGTRKLAPLFSDPGLTTSLANPMVSDENGLFGLCYLIDGVYRVELESAKGETLIVEDEISVQTPLNTAAASEFQTLEDIRGDTLMSYDTAHSGHTVRAGHRVKVIEADHRFRVAPDTAADADLTTAGGVKLYAEPDAGGFVTFRQLGAAGDGVTDDRDAFLRAAGRRVRGNSGDTYFIGVGDYTESVRITDNTTWDLDGCKIEWDYFGAPLFWIGADAVNIVIDDPWIVWNGDPTGAHPHSGAELRDHFGADEATNTAYCANWLIVACDDATINRPRCSSKTPGPLKSVYINFSLRREWQGDYGKRLVITDPWMDDYMMGIQGSGFDELQILGRIYGGRYDDYSTNPACAENFAPGHLLYLSGIGYTEDRFGNKNVVLGDVFDRGLYMGANPGGGGYNAVKFRFLDGIQTGRVVSYRPHGLFDGFGIRNAHFGPMFWKSDAVRHWTLAYEGGTGDFAVGETVTAASGGTFLVAEITGGTGSGTLRLSVLTGTVADGDALTGDAAGVAVAAGVPQDAEDAYLSNAAVRLTNSPADGGASGVCENVLFENIMLDMPRIDARPFQFLGFDATHPHRNVWVQAATLRMDVSALTTALVEMDDTEFSSFRRLDTFLSGGEGALTTAINLDGATTGCELNVRHQGDTAPMRVTGTGTGNAVRFDRGATPIFVDDQDVARNMRTSGMLVGLETPHFSGYAAKYLGPGTELTQTVEVPTDGMYQLSVTAWKRNSAAHAIWRTFEVGVWKPSGNDMFADVVPLRTSTVKGTLLTDVTATVDHAGTVTLTFSLSESDVIEAAVAWTRVQTLPATT